MQLIKRIALGAFCLRNILIVAILTVGLLPILSVAGFFAPICDAGVQTLPFVFETKRMFASGTPWWSWNTFLGENFIGAYSYYTLTSPFMWLCCLVPYSLIPFAFTLSLYLKYLVCGWVADIYLKRMGFGKSLRLIGSLLFTFSSWMTCQLEYAFFIEPAIAFILLLIGIEAYLRGSRYGHTALIFGSFAVAFANYYFAPASLLAASFYFIARLTYLKSQEFQESYGGSGSSGFLGSLGFLKSPKSSPTAPRKMRGHRARSFISGVAACLARAAGCVALGIGMAAIVLVPVALYIMHTNAGGPLDLPFNFLERLRSLIMPTPFDGRAPIYFQTTGWYMNAANIAVFGLLPALYRIISRPVDWLSALLVIFIVLYLTPAGAIFSLGTSALYSRWLYALIICEVLASLYFIDDFAGREVPRSYFYAYTSQAVIIYFATAGISLLLKVKGTGLAPDRELLNLLWYALAFAVNFGTLWLLCRSQVATLRWRAIALAGICLSAVMQISAFSANRCGNGVMTNVPGLDIAGWIAGADRNSDSMAEGRSDFIYEHSAWYHPYYNTSIVENRPGISTYLSLHSSALDTISARFDSIADRVRLTPTIERPLLYTMMSVSRVRSYDTAGALPPEMPPMNVVESNSRYTDYAFPYYTTPGLVFDRLEDIGRAWAMTDTAQMRAFAESQRRHKATFEADTRGFSASLSLDHPAVVMYPVPRVDGFKAYVDGAPAEIVDGGYGMSALRLVPGRHHIRFDYFTPGLFPGAIVSLVALALTSMIFIDEKRKKP